MSTQKSPLQTVLAIVVSVGWLTIVIIPIITEVKIEQHVQIGVQAAMMLILGAIFGVQIVRRGGSKDDEKS
jgi:UPF0716 family protein affecting phage T7 exclusion